MKPEEGHVPEKRRAQRFAISQMIEVRYGRERWVHAQGVDLSITGFRCRTVEDLDPSTSIYLLLSLDEDTEITADAVLIHTDLAGDGMFEAGFAFTNFYGSSKRDLEEYLRNL